MQIRKVSIENLRGIKNAEILLPNHVVLVGDNNSCKSTVLEALDLALGPIRLSRPDPIDEHDFYAGDYLDQEGNPIEIKIEVIIIGLSEEQRHRFADYLEWWDEETTVIVPPLGAAHVDNPSVCPALRILFSGAYDPEEDGFKASTIFASTKSDVSGPTSFRTIDKRFCGFLYLRALRTGTRALSLERGSLLDIILELEEKRPQMWERVLEELRLVAVAEEPELGISDVLTRVQKAVHAYVTTEWADAPKLRVTDLTRETLRKELVLFIETGATNLAGNRHAAPFQHQGSGTINALVLALLSIIASLKQSVIFAMEEPEIAIPPHAQKRIVTSIRQTSSQAIFTSHSSYVLEEFDPSQIVVLNRSDGTLTGTGASLPPAVKPKAYKLDMRRRTCEALLARRVLVVEGSTEYLSYPAAARRLAELDSATYSALEALGVAVVDAATDSQVAPLSQYFRDLGKTVYAAVDKQTPESLAAIQGSAHLTFESPEHGFEDLILSHTDGAALKRYAEGVEADGEWPPHLADKRPSLAQDEAALKAGLRAYFQWQKATGSIAELLQGCAEDEIPEFIRESMASIKAQLAPVAKEPEDPQADGEPPGLDDS